MNSRHHYEHLLRNVARDDEDNGRTQLSDELALFRFRTWPYVLVLEEARCEEVVEWLVRHHGGEWNSCNLEGKWRIWFRTPVVIWMRDPELHTELVLRWL
jgi:hypothetical protein